jgi:hypothetical protein
VLSENEDSNMNKKIKIQLLCIFFLGRTNIESCHAEQPDPKVNPAVKFEIAEENLQQFGFSSLPATLISQIKTNLSEYGYKFPVTEPYTYYLQAKLGKISHQSTPAGFSFSSGNSDPRALEFQKADVLPVSCSLSLMDTRKLITENESTFSTESSSQSMNTHSMTETLIDHISTVCLTALEQARILKPEKPSQNQEFKPKWIPGVQVEIREKPAEATTQTDKQTDDNAEKNSSSKEIIIKNQGTPLIIQFGHERR